MNLTRQRLGLVLCAFLVSNAGSLCLAGELKLGPLWQRFDLTLGEGTRTEAGPIYYDEHNGTQHTWAIAPVLSYTRDPDLEMTEFDFVYPVLTYDRYGDQYRWQLFQLLSFAGGPTQTEARRNRFTLFPIYFQQRSSDPEENYTAYGPFYGHLKKRLMRDQIDYVMFPLYSKTRKADVVTRNYVFPIFHLREGDGLRGWQVWPVTGHEHKELTWRTNRFGDAEMVPGHDKRFVAWPLYYNVTSGLGTTNPAHQYGIIPAYSLLRSPLRDSTTVLWPFFSRIDDREREYREWDLPWPLMVFADGKGKKTRRVFPFYSRASTTNLQSDFYLWPLYKYNAIHSDAVERRRTRILFFLYSDIQQRSPQTGASLRRQDFWPLFTRRRELNGNTRLQVLAPLEPFVTGSHKIERDYSPVWSVWRDERNARTGARSQSLLWNLYRREATPDARRVSAVFGLYQSSAGPDGRQTKVLFIPVRSQTGRRDS